MGGATRGRGPGRHRPGREGVPAHDRAGTRAASPGCRGALLWDRMLQCRAEDFAARVRGSSRGHDDGVAGLEVTADLHAVVIEESDIHRDQVRAAVVLDHLERVATFP